MASRPAKVISPARHRLDPHAVESPHLPIGAGDREAGRSGRCRCAVVHLHARDRKDASPTSRRGFRAVPQGNQSSAAASSTSHGRPMTMTIEERVRPRATLQARVASLTGHDELRPVPDARTPEGVSRMGEGYLEGSRPLLHTRSPNRVHPDDLRPQGARCEVECYDLGISTRSAMSPTGSASAFFSSGVRASSAARPTTGRGQMKRTADGCSATNNRERARRPCGTTSKLPMPRRWAHVRVRMETAFGSAPASLPTHAEPVPRCARSSRASPLDRLGRRSPEILALKRRQSRFLSRTSQFPFYSSPLLRRRSFGATWGG